MLDFENLQPSKDANALFLRSVCIAYKRIANGKPEWCPGASTSGDVRAAVSAAIRRVGHNATATALAAELAKRSA